MSIKNKWKQIEPTKGHVYTISDEDMDTLSGLLPDRKSEIINDMSDHSTFIYYNLINLGNTLESLNAEIQAKINHIGWNAPPEIKETLMDIANLAQAMYTAEEEIYDKIAPKLQDDPSENLEDNPSKSLEDSSSESLEQPDDAIDFKAGSPRHLDYIEKQHPGTVDKWLTNQLTKKPKEEKHFGEEQIADLRNLLNGVQGVM